MEKYLVPDYTDVHEFLVHLGKRLGKLKKGIGMNGLNPLNFINCHLLNMQP